MSNCRKLADEIKFLTLEKVSIKSLKHGACIFKSLQKVRFSWFKEMVCKVNNDYKYTQQKTKISTSIWSSLQISKLLWL